MNFSIGEYTESLKIVCLQFFDYCKEGFFMFFHFLGEIFDR